MALQGIGLCRYNGFTFGADTVTQEFRVTPVDDRARRTHSHYIVAITLRTYITGRPADPAVADAVRRLTQKGAALEYRGKGLGTYNVNAAGGTPDMLWGPSPKMVSVKPKGGGNAVELVWQVEFATMTCLDAVFDNTQPMEFVWSCSYDIDYAGLTKRTYKAFLRIAGIRRFAGDRAVLITADEFRERATPALAPGFRRTTPAAVTVSEDKCQLELTCVDEEFGNNIYPPGVVSAESAHTVASEPGKLFTWTATLTARFELAKGTPVAVARDFFLDNMLRERIDEFRRNPEVLFSGAVAVGASAVFNAVKANNVSVSERLGRAGFGGLLGFALTPPAGPKMANVTGPAIIPWSFSFTEPQVFGRNIFECSAVYRIVAASRDLILAASGLWTPVKGTDWKKWAASVAVHQGPRGYMRMVLNPGDDSIKDNCARQGVGVALGRAAPPKLNGGVLVSGPKNPFPALDAGRSWLDYSATLRVEQDSGVVTGVTLPSTPLPVVPPRSGVGGGGRLVADFTQYGESYVQRRTVPQTYVILTGYGMRAGFPVPRPELGAVNGVRPVECSRSDMGEGFEQRVVGQCGVPIYYAKWALRYAVVGVPPAGTIPVPANPLTE